jgi:hypothetical protein
LLRGELILRAGVRAPGPELPHVWKRLCKRWTGGRRRLWRGPSLKIRGIGPLVVPEAPEALLQALISLRSPWPYASMACSSSPTLMIAITRFML